MRYSNLANFSLSPPGHRCFGDRACAVLFVPRPFLGFAKASWIICARRTPGRMFAPRKNRRILPDDLSLFEGIGSRRQVHLRLSEYETATDSLTFVWMFRSEPGTVSPAKLWTTQKVSSFPAKAGIHLDPLIKKQNGFPLSRELRLVQRFPSKPQSN